MGDRLYGSVLRIYDRIKDFHWLHKVFRNHPDEWGSVLPEWLVSSCSATDFDINNSNTGNSKESVSSSTDNYDDEINGKMKTSASTPTLRRSGAATSVMNNSDVIFLPRCLVILSHHPFFDIYRKFLLQIYRITLVEAPLPIERFIANFVREVPLPPPGKIQVKCGFTLDDTWLIERPPENQLPLVNFSYQPLFTTLSITNILVIMGCLLQEHRIALLSKYHSLLGPTAEALLSLLFPFHWQGMYLPIMPYSMLDILDAPVPYLVGLNSKYFYDVPIERRPMGVIFVDLDNDIVYLGHDDRSTISSPIPRQPPSFPEKQISKLKTKLIEYGSSVYILPENRVFGKTMSGDNHDISSSTTPLTATERRESFLYLSLESHHSHSFLNSHSSTTSSTTTPMITNQYHKFRRKDVLINTDRAYKENELLRPIDGFLSEQGQFSSERDMMSISSSSKLSGGGNTNSNSSVSSNSLMTPNKHHNDYHQHTVKSNLKQITTKLPTFLTRPLSRSASKNILASTSTNGSGNYNDNSNITNNTSDPNDMIHLLEMNEVSSSIVARLYHCLSYVK